MKRVIGGILALTLSVSIDLARAETNETPAPASMQGIWAEHGRCDIIAERLTITAHAARYGNQPFAKIIYDAENSAIEWAEEGVVDNYVSGRSQDVLIHNTQGFHMPGERGMARCGPRLIRVPWPSVEATEGRALPQFKLEMTPEDGHQDPAIAKRYSAKFSACQRRAVATPENEACFVAEFTRRDGELNQAWRATLGRISPALRMALLKAQREWIVARDPFCRRVSDAFSGGTIAPIVYEDCRVEQTIRRMIWLESLH
jgi:uncharacterized protein YecT (DUF1311 family)